MAFISPRKTRDLSALLAEVSSTETRLGTAAAAALLREHYALEGEIEPLSGERDENLRLTTPDGAQYVLKIASLREDPAVTDMQVAVLQHLEASASELPCPRVLRTRDGQAVVQARDASGTPRSARVLTFLGGMPLRIAERSTEQRIACARLVARMGRALRDFQHRAARRPLLWDLRQLPKMRRLLEQLPELPEQPAIRELIAQYEMQVEPRYAKLRQQPIHNDLNDRNVLVNHADPARIAGFIDFGDMLHTALVADLAILIAEQLTDEPSLARTVTDLAGAYHAEEPLKREELALLRPLIAARIVMSVVIPSWHRQQHPGDPHYARVDHDFVRRRIALARRVMRMELKLP